MYPDYNKAAIKEALTQTGIYYRNYVAEFGARQEDRWYYTDAGYLDFEKFAESNQFQSGFRRLITSMEQRYRFALMCAEKDPIDCHRAIMVARAFHEAGCDVRHLIPGGRVETQVALEQRLLDMYFLQRDQLTLFEAAPDEVELLQEVYRKRNAEIGFRISEE